MRCKDCNDIIGRYGRKEHCTQCYQRLAGKVAMWKNRLFAIKGKIKFARRILCKLKISEEQRELFKVAMDELES